MLGLLSVQRSVLPTGFQCCDLDERTSRLARSLALELIHMLVIKKVELSASHEGYEGPRTAHV
eukprot:37795-Amphidinium_carterae.1